MNIKSINFSKELTKEEILYLAKMVNTIPLPKEWHEISDKLISNRSNYRKVMDERINIQTRSEVKRKKNMTEEEKAKEKAWWKAYHEDPDPHKFYGNMGQPETAEDFKNRYGIWPPNYKPDEEKKKDT